MALEWYLSLGSDGGVEIANHARLAAYLESVGSPLDTVTACGCETFDAALVGDDPYTSPEADDAPWYDPDVPESADFAGLLVLSVDGLDDHPVERTVTRGAAGNAALGPARTMPRTITVTAVLLGATCCAVNYGLRWLGQALAGCTGVGCGGDCLTLFTCCPDQIDDPDEFAARYRRTLRRVALVDGPRVVARHGTGCTGSGGCTVGADILTVEFVLTAASPWMWTDPVPVLEVPVPLDESDDCITWCVHPSPGTPGLPVCVELTDSCPPGSVAAVLTDAACDLPWPERESLELPCDQPCRLAACPDMDALCSDPSCRTPAPPVAPPPATCFCSAIAVTEEAYELDLSSWPAWFGAVPIITVEAGSQDLRRVTVTLFERRDKHEGMTCREVAVAERCSPHSQFEISYVPAGGVMTLDGQVGRATVECAGTCESTPDAYGRDGGPLHFPLLTCDRYCVLVEADAIFAPAPDAAVSISLSGREY
ncbi:MULTISPECIES: hypothetical protein [Streptomyces]|uniref:Uncharacterized protein n=1 Tax=Streptomyces flavovirens TaxID=52258 RepID=A0ABV8NDD8_9ACTN|nr:hypothetical protein [Streptomyces sp. MBT51]MBK3592432.1 hypothetical protein [Streptomyces sp. MBT51]